MASKNELKICGNGAPFSNMVDRFVCGGYKDPSAEKSIEEMAELYAKIGVDGISCGYDENAVDPIKFKEICDKYGFAIATCAPENYITRRWKYGTFCARDPKTRAEIIRLGKEGMDYAAAVGAADVMFWMAHDGYDYPFQDNYDTAWNYMVESIQEIASYRSDVTVTLEYKKFEPLTHQYASDTGKVLLLAQATGCDNVKVIVDYGHALFGGENPAESAMLVNRYGKLQTIHLNDNWGNCDDDLIFGSVSFWQALEFFYVLDTIGFDGYYLMDNWPARMDGYEATVEHVAFANQIMRLAKSLPKDEIAKLQAQDANTPSLLKLLRSYVLKEY